MAKGRQYQDTVFRAYMNDVDCLQEHESEVIDMVNFEWNQKDFEEAVREEVREAETSAFILGMLKEKLPLETIARVSKMSVERIQELGRMHSLL